MRSASLCLLVLVMAGCAAVNPRAQARPSAGDLSPQAASPGAALAPGETLLSSYVQQVREVSRRARPSMTGALVAEQWSRDLADAISRVAASPGAWHELGLAQAYVRAGILDQGYEHFAAALRLDPRLSAAWDGKARVWRDWGFPHFGLGDAYRAVSADPASPVARNTLGTILQYLGRGRDARKQFAQAVALDPGAAYAQNNICYSWLMEANVEAASNACGRALAIDPDMVPARNNLALAMAVDGDLEGASRIFGAAGGDAAAQYNLGIVYLAQRRYSAAAAAFDRAAELQPALTLARARARQARQHAGDVFEGEGGDHERR